MFRVYEPSMDERSSMDKGKEWIRKGMDKRKASGSSCYVSLNHQWIKKPLMDEGTING